MWPTTQFVVFSVFLLPFAISKNCETLDGFWYNQLGSEMYLNHSSDGKLVGEYRTAVERYKGSAGSREHSMIFGAAPYKKKGSTFAFAVVWRNGSSTTVWTAQCIVCAGGKEEIQTSWLLRSQVKTCLGKWKSTLIGRDFFTRQEQRPGPRKQDKKPPILPHITTDFDSLNSTKGMPCDVTGTWYNDLGSEMIIKQDNKGIIVGEYRTAVERVQGSAGKTHSKVYGIGSPGNENGTFAFFVVWRGGASVAGFVGQCHICGVGKTEQIESTWLLKSKISKCEDNWKSVLFGENVFTHEEQRPGPRKHLGTHTPERDADNVSDVS